MSTTTKKVAFGQKVAFGIGMLANQMFPAVLGIFMVVLVQDLGFPPESWALLFFLPRIFDSITDPIMGFISDNTRSKWGRRRQYVLIGAIIMGISFTMMWQLYRTDGIDYNFTYFLIWSLGFYLGLTIFSVPYVAMGYEMSTDFHERTNIMAVAQWIGQWAWVIAPWFWVIMYDKGWFESADVATRSLAIWVGIVCALFAMVPAIFLKSESTKDRTDLIPLSFKTIGSNLIGLAKGFVAAFSSIPFLRLCISTFFVFNAFNTIAAFSFFIIVYHLFGGDAGAAGVWPTLFGSLGAIATTFLVIPIVTKLSKRVGKKRAFLISQGISLIGYIMLWFLFIPGKPYMFIFALPLFSFGIGGLFVLMMSMTADVIDLDELKNGKRREGVFGAIYWWMVKFGFAIAGLGSGYIMAYVGFTPDAPTQPEGAIDGLRLFFSGVPMIGTLIAIILMWRYNIDEKRANEIRAELERRKKPTSFYQTGKLATLMGSSVPTDSKYDIDFSGMSTDEIKSLFSKSLNGGLHGICFSPYTEGQDIADQLSEAQIQRRMDVIAPYTKWVRSFSCTNGNELIPQAAHNKGLKTMVGAWIGNDKAQNNKEIDALIQLAKNKLVDIAVVGNEVLMRGDLSVQEIIAHINKVKKELPGIPVGYVDAYYQFHEHPELIEVCDVILANCYPFWEGSNIEEATRYLRQMYTVTKDISKGKPVIITETGWPNQGDSVAGATPTTENAMKYFISASNMSKKNSIPLFYFSSFDESWKVHQEGDVGARWGLWDTSEKLKY